jgi:uncharacterized protein (DUF1697 family)
MPRFISLLRGINISGQKQIRMADLTALYEGSGFSDVRTYIQSGNVVFNARGKAGSLSKKIQGAVQKRYGFNVQTLVMTANEFAEVVKSNPFLKSHANETSALYITFLFAKPYVDFASIDLPKSGDEDAKLHKGHVYFYGPNGYGRTKLNNNYFERVLKVPATTRNWKTVQTLNSMLVEQ